MYLYHPKISILQYLELRFGKTIRSFTTLVFVFTVTMMLPVGSFLPAFAFAESRMRYLGITSFYNIINQIFLFAQSAV